MASCEKCWNDAFLRSIENPMVPQALHYQTLIEERRDNPCTPEEQAGEGATVCEACKSKTVHQFAKVCCKCGKNAKIKCAECAGAGVVEKTIHVGDEGMKIEMDVEVDCAECDGTGKI